MLATPSSTVIERKQTLVLKIYNKTFRLFLGILLFSGCHNIFLHNPSNTVPGQMYVTLHLTYLLNNKNYNTCFLTICFSIEPVLTEEYFSGNM